MNARPPGGRRSDGRLRAWAAACAALSLLGAARMAHADARLAMDYRNVWYPRITSPTQTNAAQQKVTSAYGSLETLTNGTRRIRHAQLGVPVGAIPANFSLGEALPIPDDWDGTTAPTVNFLGGPTCVIWLSYANLLLATDQGVCTITWRLTGGGTTQSLYTISPNPDKRPVRLYWTEGQYAGPLVTFGKNYEATIHYNSQITSTNDVWIDTADMMHARRDLTGRFLLTYSRMDGDTRQRELLAWEIVEVLQPMSCRQDVFVGDRLLPISAQYSTDDLFSEITRGLVDETGQHPEWIYVYKHNKGRQNGWIWAIRDTEDEPWRIEIYWKAQEALGVVWPFEVDIYNVAWNPDCQKHVFADEASVPVLMSTQLAAEIQPRQFPGAHAWIDDAMQFWADDEGYCLVKYSLDDEVWFESVRSLRHHAPEVYKGTATRDIGTELTAWGTGVVAGDYDDWPGYIWEPAGTRYHKEIYDYPTAYAESNEGLASYVYGVNTGLLEVWWFNRCAQDLPKPVFWPSVVCGYTNAWPADAPKIIIASGLGTKNPWLSGTLSLGMSLWENGQHLAVNAAPLDSPTDFTIETWIYPRDLNLCIASKGTTGPRFMLVNGRPGINRPDAPGSYLVADTAVPVNQLSHVAVTFKTLSETACRVRFYVNGNAAGGGTVAAPMPANTSPFWIGRYNNGTSDTWGRSRMDEFRVWSAERTHLQIKQYRWGGIDPGAAELVLWYRCNFNEGDWDLDAGMLKDTSVWGRNATLVGGATRGTVADVPRCEAGTSYIGRSPRVYYENDPAAVGYNPNEEHAFVQGGTVYALRNDLARPDTSEPFVIVTYDDLDRQRPDVDVYAVVATNAMFGYERELDAGLRVQAPMPLAMMQPAYCTRNEITAGPQFRDRKGYHWARQAGDSGGTTNMVLRFYYPMQPGFYFPSRGAAQPEALTEIPWLSGDNIDGVPVTWTYEIRWPDGAPSLYIGDTLTTAKSGLPAIRGQLSVNILYEQSVALGGSTKRSVVLIDPTAARGAPLASIPAGMKTARDPRTGFTLFSDLPPALRSRLYYDPTASPGQALRLVGEFKERTDGHNYLLLNVLTAEERAQVKDDSRIAGIDASWSAAIDALPQTVIELGNDTTPFDSLALSAVGTGTGYVTVVFNDSVNTDMVDPGENVAMKVFRVDAPLYRGRLAVITSSNPLDRQQTLKYTADFGGRPERYLFGWEYGEPASGVAPDEGDPRAWHPLALDEGLHQTVIGDAGVFGLADHYVRCRYAALDPVVQAIVGTNFNAWTPPVLAEGWIKRVMKAVNPFDQRIRDMMTYELNTQLSVIQQIGAPYAGDIPLNLEALNDYGLLAIYRTILEQARDLSIDAGIDGGLAVSMALMMAAGRLNDLNMVLGNEAYADAMDPTIGLGTDDPVCGDMASSLFCFENQQPTLLDEELALLRGRDDALNPPVSEYPVYNRLPWNFTADIVGGQPAYVLNYGISDAKGDQDGFIDVDDAIALYPQGHGDAWGYYLGALKCYNELLRHDYFSWMPQAEGILAGDTEITVSFLHEKKMAAAAAAKARAGVSIVDRTYRQRYEGESDRPWSCHYDTSTNRAWGVGEWAARAGMGAYLDWLVCNAVLPARDADSGHSGIQIIDRATVPELNEIGESFTHLQRLVDQADIGLNPLGLAPGAVPFDISEFELDWDHTHFEQAYAKALDSLQNAVAVFDRVKTCGQALRDQNENGEFDLAVQQEEAAIERQLIELYGYPYSDDIGPGKLYPQGYGGPDLSHYNYIEIYDWDGETEGIGRTIAITVTNLYSDGCVTANYSTAPFGDADMEAYFGTLYDENASRTYQVPNIVEEAKTLTLYVGPDGMPGRPPTYTGHRRAEGEIQIALCDFVKSIKEFQESVILVRQARDNVYWVSQKVNAELAAAAQTAGEKEEHEKTVRELKRTIQGIDTFLGISDLVKDFGAGLADAFAEAPPEGFDDLTSVFRSSSKGVYAAALAVRIAVASPLLLTKGICAQAIEDTQYALNRATDKIALSLAQQQAVFTLEDALFDMIAPLRTVVQKAQAAESTRMRYMQVLAKGDALQVERERLRMNRAAELSASRYRNMAYRIFRNDALVRYQHVFDNAARYVYLTAKAYDYETGLLASDAQHAAGRDFMRSIVKARTLGWLSGGRPMVGGSLGEPGLADVMGRMKANWDVLDGRLNFSNPETETGRFSLRTELFRISASTNSDAAWRRTLEQYVVDNVLDLPEFRRYCLPFYPEQPPEPALVIPFSSTIEFRKNFFGRDLAGGDNAYDSSHFATKIRRVGLWFSNYNNVYDAGGASGLANQPRVYLVPAGVDVMVVPDGTSQTIREWNVVDQAMPVPYPINEEDWLDPDWGVLKDMLGDELYNTRKHGSFRAYHDNGVWTEAEVCGNVRLIGRSVWNTRWVLIIPGGTLLVDAEKGIERFINGTELAPGVWNGNGVKDIKLIFQTYSYAGN